MKAKAWPWWGQQTSFQFEGSEAPRRILIPAPGVCIPEHSTSSRSGMVSGLSLSLSSCCRHPRVSIRIVSANPSFSAVQIPSRRRQQCWFLISVLVYLSEVFARISYDKMWEWDNRFLSMSQTSGNGDWNVFLNSYFKTGHPVSWHSHLEFFSFSNTIF